VGVSNGLWQRKEEVAIEEDGVQASGLGRRRRTMKRGGVE